MSIILRLGAVPNNDVGGYKDLSSEYCGVERGIGGGNRGLEEHYEPASLSYPGCFGLPYQDHNYGAPPPPTPPPVPTEESPPLQKFTPQTVVPTDNVSYHTEVKDLGSIPAVPCEEVPAASAATEVYPVEDNSITRCICNFIHDDGYMICCDKCSVWQHIDCMGVNRNNIPDTYFCELCEPRPLDTERARQIQLKKKEFLDTLTDSSATDTDPEEASNRQMAQQQQQSMENNNLFQGLKKVKKKRRSKSGNNNSKVNNKVDGKQKKPKREKKDVKKEKENKELNKSQKVSNTKDTIPVLKTRKSKLQASKKPGLSLIINENTQDPWDSSYSPWVDKYEEAGENLYSADIQSLFTSNKINGVNTTDKIVPNGQLLVQLCHVTDVNKNRKGLEASETIGEGEIVIEYTGKVMLKHQFDKDNFFRYLNPFVLFYSKFENVELCIDATTYGNTARFIRRSCKANAEVRHVLKNGKIYFYVYSTKVIPRGSEITIPYDYNYKECTYCVECACLRNNCAVSKYFKRKMNANNKKDKSPMKTPKSPVKSPVKMKEKDKQASQSPIESAESLPPPVVTKELSPKKEPQTSCSSSTSEQVTVSRVVTRAASLDQNMENCNSSLTTQSTESHSENEESTSAEKNQHKMTREERKMEAIMKAFEKLEKREERRKEALNRMDCRKSTETKKEEKEPQSEPTVLKKEVKKEKVKTKEKEKEKQTKSEEVKAVVLEEKAPEIEVPVKEEKPEILPEEPEKITVDEKVEEEIKPEIPVEVPSVETVKEKPKPRVKRSKKVSNRRRSRANSGSVAVMEHSLSMPEEESISTPAQASCPSTPISAPVDVTTTSPSFKFLKTKKHLMNEWLSEKCQESFMSPEPLPEPGKMEPLEVKVEETIFVSCLPSPRNAMDHLRRNSQSSGSAVGKSNVAESSVGSAKKRWLRQAMWEKPRSDSGSVSPVLASSGGASPSLPSPGASPPGENFVTPLKKRRMARESCDTPVGQCQSKVSPSVTPVSCADTVMSSCDDNEHVEAPSTIMEDEPSSKTPEEKSLGTVSKMGIPKKRNFLIHIDYETPTVNDSSGETDSNVSQMTSSHDECLDIEQDKTINVTDTGNNVSEFHSGLENMEDRTSDAAEGSSLVDEKECEVTNSVKDTRSIENNPSCSIDQLSVDAECSSFRNDEEAVEISGGMNDNEEGIMSETEEIITEGSECPRVDSTEDQISESPEQILERHNICDSTSRSDDLKVTGVRVESSQQVISASYVCNSENVEESSPCVVSSTDSRKLSGEHMDYSQTYRVEVDSASRENSEQLSSIQTDASVVDNSVCKNSGSEIVGSSSDENKETCLSGSVSSSSETRTSHTMTLEPQSTSMDNAGVTSSINLSENSNLVSESESADSSVCEVNFSMKADSEEVTNETQNLSNSSFVNKQEEISSAQDDLSVEHFMEATSSSTVEEEESAIPQSAEVPTSLVSTVSEMPNLDVDSTSTTNPEQVPPPQKKKVSLLEYRQRLKEKGSTTTTKSILPSSSLSSSSSHRSSSSSSSTQSVHSHPSCLSSLPSLPLFDATSPTRDSSVRHQFKSSSDLIRRKSVEKKREKPLSLTERLKQEFGFEEDEEEPAKEEKPPDPPPPQSSTHVPPPVVGQQGGTPHMTQMAHNIQGSIQTGCQLPVMMRGHASSMVPAQGSSIPPQHSGVVNPLHSVILPSQSSTPGQNSVPPPPSSSLAGVNGSNHAPQTTSHFGPGTIPASVGNGPDSSVTGPIAGTGRKIPSLMSLQTFPSQNRVPNKQQKSGNGSGVPHVNGPIQTNSDQSFLGQHQGMLPQNQLGCNPHHQSPHSQQGFKASQSTTSQTGQQHIYPPPPQASVGNGGRQPAFHQQNQSHSYNQQQDGTNFNLLPHAQSSSLCEQSHLQANGVVLLDYNHGYGSASKIPHDSVHHQQSLSGYSPEGCHSQGSVQRKKARKSKYKKDNCHSRNYSDYH